jgi:murein DD-endopeptidase MepM/ murein hydrolase activator NlpD
MKKLIFYPLIVFFIMCCSSAFSEITSLQSLTYDDPFYNAMSESTFASKNRMIRKERADEYTSPQLYRYVMKPREDIWTIIAKTSLTIDSIATLNRIDFIGMIREEMEVFLPDTLGLFFETSRYEKETLALRYEMSHEDILLVDDPLDPSRSLYFLPEKKLSFLERTYLMGVVFHAPIVGIRTSGYGERLDPFVNDLTFHGGVDIATDEGKTVHASRGGTVFYADENGGYGNLVILKHELGYFTLYGHLSEITVEQDQLVETGMPIGTVGISGKTTGPHLHFEIRRYDEQLNPENIPLFFATEHP